MNKNKWLETKLYLLKSKQIEKQNTDNENATYSTNTKQNLLQEDKIDEKLIKINVWKEY